MTDTETPEAPTTDERDPAMLVPAAIDEVLRLAATWLAWDGAPRFGEGNAWTPHKALRRVNDHLLDHLAEIDALLAGAPTVADTWHGRTVTLDTDWARFTEADLDEASSRLRRYAELYRLRLADLSKDDLDRAAPPRGRSGRSPTMSRTSSTTPVSWATSPATTPRPLPTRTSCSPSGTAAPAPATSTGCSSSIPRTRYSRAHWWHRSSTSP